MIPAALSRRHGRSWPLLACCLVPALAHAFEVPEVTCPAIAGHAATLEALVPAGWRLEHAARGPLDADAHEDALLVLRMDDPANIVDNAGFGPDRFDTNPRMLVAALGQPGGGWRVAMRNHQLVPRPESPVMDDFLDGDPGAALSIRPNRTWQLALHSWASAGTWSTRRVRYTFRLDPDCMRLVGYDEMHLHRGSGQTTTTSVNYLSGRAWTRSGSIEHDSDGPRRWLRLASPGPVCIDGIGDGLAFVPDLPELPAD